MTIHYSEDFISDLDELQSVYENVMQTPTTGNELLSRIFEICDIIEKFPLVGIDFGETRGEGEPYRMMICEEYLLFYTVVDGEPIMLRVMDGRSDYMRALFGVNKRTPQHSDKPL